MLFFKMTILHESVDAFNQDDHGFEMALC